MVNEHLPRDIHVEGSRGTTIIHSAQGITIHGLNIPAENGVFGRIARRVMLPAVALAALGAAAFGIYKGVDNWQGDENNKYKGAEAVYRTAKANLTGETLSGTVSELRRQTQGNDWYQLALSDPTLGERTSALEYNDLNNTVTFYQGNNPSLTIPVGENAIDGLIKAHADPQRTFVVVDESPFYAAASSKNFTRDLADILSKTQLTYRPNSSAIFSPASEAIEDVLRRDDILALVVNDPDSINGGFFTVATPQGEYRLQPTAENYHTLRGQVTNFLITGKK